MQKYQIESWHSVISKENIIPYPIIYINHDQKLIDYIEQNNQKIPLIIQDTNSSYDNKIILGIVNHSGYFPNYRPNFFNENQYLVITLLTEWIGYPLKDGIVIINSEKETDKLTNSTSSIEHFNLIEYDKKSILLRFFIIFIIMLILIIGIFLYKKR